MRTMVRASRREKAVDIIMELCDTQARDRVPSDGPQ